MVYIGLISYSLYLWHWPLIVFTRINAGLMPIDQWIPLLLAASILLGALSHRFIEQRFRKSRATTRKHLLFAGAGVVMLAILLVSMQGVAYRGHEGRVSPEVLAMDKESSPPVPFIHCDNRMEGCRIGAESQDAQKPSILLWGDSHMLAWAPVLDSVLKERGVSASLQVASACPPVFGVVNQLNKSCNAINAAIRERLAAGEFDAVVLAAYWSTYSSGTNPDIHMDDGGGVIAEGLAETVRAIHKYGTRTVLIEPVPVYGQDVPKTRALFAMQGKRLPTMQSRQQYLEMHSDFFDALSAVDASDIFNVSDVFCASGCLVADAAGVGLYRDGHHLSINGAMKMDAGFGALFDGMSGANGAASTVGGTEGLNPKASK